MFAWNLIYFEQVYIVGVGKGVVVMYYYLHIFIYPSIESDSSKSNVQIGHFWPCSSHHHYPFLFVVSLPLRAVKFQSWNCTNWWMRKTGCAHLLCIKGDVANCLSSMKELKAKLRSVLWGFRYIVVDRMAIIKSSRNYECVIVCYKCICWKLNRYFQLFVISKVVCIGCIMNGELLTPISVVKWLMQVLDFLFASMKHKHNQCQSKHSQCNTEDNSHILFWSV